MYPHLTQSTILFASDSISPSLPSLLMNFWPGFPAPPNVFASPYFSALKVGLLRCISLPTHPIIIPLSFGFYSSFKKNGAHVVFDYCCMMARWSMKREFVEMDSIWCKNQHICMYMHLLYCIYFQSQSICNLYKVVVDSDYRGETECEQAGREVATQPTLLRTQHSL